MKVNVKKITITAILTALSLIAFLIESLLPPLIISGAKIGLSNIFLLIIIVYAGFQYGYMALIIKVILGSVFIGNISAILYSLPSGIISITIEILLIKKAKIFSLTAISIFGAVINSIIQNIVFCLITKVYGYITYLPYLSLIAVFSGLIVGILATLILQILNKTQKIKKEK